jgi:hypothetical protein
MILGSGFQDGGGLAREMRKTLLKVNPNGIEFINFSFTMVALRTRP